MAAEAQLPLSELPQPPTDTALVIKPSDATGQEVFSATIPAAQFEDIGSRGVKYSFRNRLGEVAAANRIRKVSIREFASREVVKVRIKGKDTEVPGAQGRDTMSLSPLLGTDPTVDDCFSGGQPTCTTTPKRTRCKQ